MTEIITGILGVVGAVIFVALAAAFCIYLYELAKGFNR